MIKNWKGLMVFGLSMMGLGFLAIGYAKWATEFTVILLGLFLIGAGIVQAVSGYYVSRWTAFLGLLYIVAGIFCIAKPLQSAISISLLIALMLLIGGVYRIITSLKLRFNNWGLVFFNGLMSILLGFLILAEWPADATWVIGLFVGIDLIFMGLYWIRLSLLARKG